MQGLPHKEMGLTLEVSLLDQKARIWEIIEHRPNVLIRAELVDETTKALISDDSHLNQVTWASNGIRAYIYLRIGFTPRIRTKYMLTIEVLEPDAKAGILSAEAIIQNSCSL